MWLKVTGFSGAAAVTLGAIGAHAFKAQSESMRDIWKIASQYHFIHTLALGMSALHFTGRKRRIVCSLFSIGITFFSGALYTIVILDQKKPFNQLAPFGGLALIGGWICMAIL